MKLAKASSAASDREVDIAVQAEDIIKRGNEAIRKKMAKPGALKLPPLLEARRIEYLMPDGVFSSQAMFDRILVMQIKPERAKTGTFGGGLIHMPATSEARITDEASRGIIVSAGLKALDNLRSNGCDLGHIVRFIRNAPWRMDVDTVEGHEVYELVMRDGDLVASEDLAEALRRGECSLLWDAQAQQHVYVDKDGEQWKPRLPWIQDDL